MDCDNINKEGNTSVLDNYIYIYIHTRTYKYILI